jgi:hypothetical protein
MTGKYNCVTYLAVVNIIYRSNTPETTTYLLQTCVTNKSYTSSCTSLHPVVQSLGLSGRLSGRLSPHVRFFVWIRMLIWLLHNHLKKITYQLVTLDRRARQVSRLSVPDDGQKYREIRKGKNNEKRT